jgi:Recombination endonuclease VII
MHQQNDQLTFLPQPDNCEHPMLSATSAYRYGCRCRRCTAGKRNGGGLSPYCHVEDCSNLRLKSRRYCADHVPADRVRIKRMRLIATCEIPRCGRTIEWYESTLQANIREDVRDLYRRVCGRHRQPYMGVIKSHHLNSAQALELLLATHCTYCGEQLATLSSGRKDVVVDHDHDCCQHSSCGRCVRGFVHPRCNTEIGFLETVERGNLGLERALTYLKQYREGNNVTVLRTA